MTKDTNSGDYNSGDYNSGNWNSGDRNSGDGNSGNWNSGDGNSGNWNFGDGNSGDGNSGDYNSGNYNSGNRNSGAFNRDEPKMRLFEKELDMTVSEFYDKYLLYIQLPICRWIDKLKMTDQERKAIPSCETTGGYLKELEYKEAWQVWWSENPDNHDRFLKLPGFDAGIFKDITGIDVEQVSKPKTINIGGTEYEVTPELTKALSGLKEVR